MSDQELLAAYADEMGLGSFSVGQLIDSHRRLRQINKEYNDQAVKEWEIAKQRGHEVGLKQAGESVVSIERLQTMSVQELATLIVKE